MSKHQPATLEQIARAREIAALPFPSSGELIEAFALVGALLATISATRLDTAPPVVAKQDTKGVGQ